MALLKTKRTDAELQRDVSDELRWDPQTRDTEIAVAVKDGVVTLAGFVNSWAQKYWAQRVAERVSGLHAIADELQVKLPGSSQKTDTELAHAVTNALRDDVLVPAEKIKARVDDGWVTLEGTVDWQFEREAAERAVRRLVGVKSVTNLIALRPQPLPVDVQQRIKDALRRSAEIDAERIMVDVQGNKVILRGTTHSWAEMREAERAAWAVPGVTQVEDRLTIAVD
jgi:osmotically-inducible protein OsmY